MKLIVVLSMVFALGNCQFGLGNLPSPGNPLNAAANAAKSATDTAKATAGKATELLTKQFGDFKDIYKKTYATAEEELLRKNIFSENSDKILKLAQDAALPFKLKVNEYSDLLHDEFNKAVNGFKKTGKPAEKEVPAAAKSEPPKEKVPESIDWRERGAVSPVKSQGLCAGCWAFSAAGALEGHYFRKSGKLIEISPQNLIDCAGPYGNDGCQGGLMNPAYQYIKENKGVNLIGAYPFEAKDGKCRYAASKDSEIANTGYLEIPSGDEKALEAIVGTLGPVAVAVDASQDAFQFYSEGVYYDPKCGNKPDDMNHAMLVVGYGAEADGTKYWIVKNSYGNTWGMEGYIKMAKERGNNCGIATYASYPKV